jgi:hypothetical protein
VKRTPAERLYQVLLWAHPPAFRRQFGEEILQLLRTATHRATGRELLFLACRDGFASLARQWGATVFDRRPLGPFGEPRSGEPMRNLARDLGLAARLLVRGPAFTIAAVLTLALGIGANTAMFALAEATLLRPVQVREPERLVVWSWTSSYPDYQEYVKRTDVFEGVAAVGSGGRWNLVIDGASELARSAFVTGQTFDVLGVRAAHGRTILPADDIANGPLVAVLNYDYWRTRLAAIRLRSDAASASTASRSPSWGFWKRASVV